MTSALDIVIATERHLVHHARESRNRLAVELAVDATSLDLTFDEPLPSTGQLLGIDFELFHVWSGGAQTGITVEGAQEGSTSAAHDAGVHVVFDPKFPRHTILKAINDTLADLSSPMRGLFRVEPIDITFQAGVYAYDLDDTGDVWDIYDVAWRPIDSTEEWRTLKPFEYRLDRDLNTDDFPSGNAVVLPPGIISGRTVRVLYRGAFGAITATTSNVASTSGLPESALDILSLGAAVRLLAPLEPSRNYTDSQGDTRRAEEVPPGAQDRSVRALLALRDDRIKAEAARLRAKYPLVRR